MTKMVVLVVVVEVAMVVVVVKCGETWVFTFNIDLREWMLLFT